MTIRAWSNIGPLSWEFDLFAHRSHQLHNVCSSRHDSFLGGSYNSSNLFQSVLPGCLSCRDGQPLAMVASPHGGFERQQITLDVVKRQTGTGACDAILCTYIFVQYVFRCRPPLAHWPLALRCLPLLPSQPQPGCHRDRLRSAGRHPQAEGTKEANQSHCIRGNEHEMNRA